MPISILFSHFSLAGCVFFSSVCSFLFCHVLYWNLILFVLKRQLSSLNEQEREFAHNMFYLSHVGTRKDKAVFFFRLIISTHLLIEFGLYYLYYLIHYYLLELNYRMKYISPVSEAMIKHGVIALFCFFYRGLNAFAFVFSVTNYWSLSLCLTGHYMILILAYIVRRGFVKNWKTEMFLPS